MPPLSVVHLGKLSAVPSILKGIFCLFDEGATVGKTAREEVTMGKSKGLGQTAQTPATLRLIPGTHYAHIGLCQWSSLPQGEEVITFALRGPRSDERILSSADDWSRRAWLHQTLSDLPPHTTLFYGPGIETLLFEGINSGEWRLPEQVTVLPATRVSTECGDAADSLLEAVRELTSQASSLLASRKRELKAQQVARGEVRWVESFTDGSFLLREKQGASAFVRDDGAFGALRFRASNSNEAEFVAALIAISSAQGGERVSVNSDSRLVVRTLSNLVAVAEGRPEPAPLDRHMSRLEEEALFALAEVLARVEPGDVRVRWVRAHCGNRMNQGADRLAKAMRRVGGRPRVASAVGIVREATGVSAPVSYGFTTTDLAVPVWFSDYLKNGDGLDVEDSGAWRIDGPFGVGEVGGDGWVDGRASA